jgi:hypothetical protein
MNTQQQQAYINGFVKRASEYGLTHNEAIELLKKASPKVSPEQMNTRSLAPGALTAAQAGKGSGGLFPGGARDMSAAQLKALRLPTPLPLETPSADHPMATDTGVLQGPTPSGIPLDMMSSLNPAHANDLGRYTR